MADAAASAAVEKLRTKVAPLDALGRVLAFHVDEFEREIARPQKFWNRKNLLDNARAITNVAREMAPYVTPKLSAVAVQSENEHRFVVRLPEICNSGEEWLAKYKPHAEPEAIKRDDVPSRRENKAS